MLAGYTSRFVGGRIFVLGETEIAYLLTLDDAARRHSLEMLFAFDLPCLVVTKNQDVPPELIALAEAQGIPLLRSALKTAEFYSRLKPVLEARNITGRAFIPYYSFAQKLGKLSRTYADKSLQMATADLVDLYEARSLDRDTLLAICASLIDVRPQS